MLGFPTHNTPFLGEDGLVSRPWYNFLNGAYRYISGESAAEQPQAVPVTTVAGQDASALATSNPNYAARWQDPATALHLVVNATVTPADANPVEITLWTAKSDGTNRIWHGPFTVTRAAPVVQLGKKGGSTSLYVPTLADENWIVIAELGAIDADTDPTAAAITSAAFAVAAPAVPAVTACSNARFLTDASNAYRIPAGGAPSIYRYAQDDQGNWTWNYYRLEWQVPVNDPEFFYSAAFVQHGNVSGGVFTATGPAQEIDRRGAADADAGGIVGISGDPYPDWGFDPNAAVFRVWIVSYSRRGTSATGGAATGTQQNCWSGAANHFDLVPSGASVSSVTPSEVGPRVADEQRGLTTSVDVAVTLSNNTGDTDVTAWTVYDWGQGRGVEITWKGWYAITGSTGTIHLTGENNLWVTLLASATVTVYVAAGRLGSNEPPQGISASFTMNGPGTLSATEIPGVSFLGFKYVREEGGYSWRWRGITGSNPANPEVWYGRFYFAKGSWVGGVWTADPNYSEWPVGDTEDQTVTFSGSSFTTPASPPEPIPAPGDPYPTFRWRLLAFTRRTGDTGVQQSTWPGGANAYYFTPNNATISGCTASEVGPRMADENRGLTTSAQVNVTVANNPFTAPDALDVTVWTVYDSGHGSGTVTTWKGWWPITGASGTIALTGLNNLWVTLLASTTVTIRVAAGTFDSNDPIPSSAATATFTMAGPAALAGAALPSVSFLGFQYVRVPGGYAWSWLGITGSNPTNPEVWYGRFYLAKGSYSGGIWTADPNYSEWPVGDTEDQTVDLTTNPGHYITPASPPQPMPGPGDPYPTFRWRLLAFTRRSGDTGTQQSTWPSAANAYYFTPDQAKASVLATDLDASTLGPNLGTGTNKLDVNAPGNVTIGTPFYADLGSGNYQLYIPYATPSPLGVFTGVLAEIEMPDQSGITPLKADGTMAWGGTGVPVGNHHPLTFGPINYDGNAQVSVTVAAPSITETVRIRLRSCSDVATNPASGSPSVTLTLPGFVGIANPGSAAAFSAIATWGDSPASASAPYNDTGTSDQDITFTGIVEPNDPNYSGWEIWSQYQGDPNYYQETGTLKGSSAKITLPCPTTVSMVAFYLRTVSLQSGVVNRNPIVPGVTPVAVVTLGTSTGTVDFRSAMLASISSDLGVDPATGLFTVKNVDMSKAHGLSAQFAWDASAGVQKIVNLDVGVLKTGNLQIGGSGMISVFKQFSGASLVGIMGDDTATATNPSGTGFKGVWFKGPFGIGGPNQAQPALYCDVNGNLQINGGLVAGTVPSAANAIWAQQANIAILYAGTISADRITGGVITAKIQINSPVIYGGAISGATLSLNLNGITTTIDHSYDSFPWGQSQYTGLTCTSAFGKTVICPESIYIRTTILPAGAPSPNMTVVGSGSVTTNIANVYGTNGSSLDGGRFLLTATGPYNAATLTVSDHWGGLSMTSNSISIAGRNGNVAAIHLDGPGAGIYINGVKVL